MTPEYLKRLGKLNADRVARSILAVQPMDPDIMKHLFAAAWCTSDLVDEGYEPVSDLKLIWVKKEQQ